MEAKSYKDALKGEKAELLHLIKGTAENKKAWYFVEVFKHKLPIFGNAMKNDHVDLVQYGKVLYSGWGDNPPAELVKVVEDEYNAEPVN